MFLRAFIAAGFLFSSLTFASEPPSYYSEYFTLGVEALNWKETPGDEDTTNEWTLEDGLLLSLGYTYGTDWKTQRGLFYRHTQKMYFGGSRHRTYGTTVTDGDQKGYTLYAGFDYSRHWGRRYPLGKGYAIAPVIGLGVDGIARGKIGQPERINEDDEIKEGGEHELIVSIYNNAGIMLSRQLREGQRISLEGGIHRPLISAQKHHSDSLIRPRNATGEYLSITYNRDEAEGFFARLDYLNRRYRQSSENSDGWYQPDTSRKTLGITLGWYL